MAKQNHNQEKQDRTHSKPERPQPEELTDSVRISLRTHLGNRDACHCPTRTRHRVPSAEHQLRRARRSWCEETQASW